jgi:hypothetical protein
MKRELAVLQRHRYAVIHLARYRARKAIEQELRDQGHRVSLIAPAALNLLAHDYLAKHGERLRAEAEQTIATSKWFKSYRKPDAPFLEK